MPKTNKHNKEMIMYINWSELYQVAVSNGSDFNSI